MHAARIWRCWATTPPSTSARSRHCFRSLRIMSRRASHRLGLTRAPRHPRMTPSKIQSRGMPRLSPNTAGDMCVPGPACESAFEHCRSNDPYAGSYGASTSSPMDGTSIWGPAVAAAGGRRPASPPSPKKPKGPDLKVGAWAIAACCMDSTGWKIHQVLEAYHRL